MTDITKARADAWNTLVAMLANPIVSVESPNAAIVQCDLRKVPVDVGVNFLRIAVEKRLGDISKGSVKGGTANDVHDQRSKIVENWYNGDLNLRGGGTSDPVAAQMKLELVNHVVRQGRSFAEASKLVKGTAIAFLTAQAEQQPAKDRAKWLEERIAHYRGLAEATLAERAKAAATMKDQAITF